MVGRQPDCCGGGIEWWVVSLTVVGVVVLSSGSSA